MDEGIVFTTFGVLLHMSHKSCVPHTCAWDLIHFSGHWYTIGLSLARATVHPPFHGITFMVVPITNHLPTYVPGKPPPRLRGTSSRKLVRNSYPQRCLYERGTFGLEWIADQCNVSQFRMSYSSPRKWVFYICLRSTSSQLRRHLERSSSYTLPIQCRPLHVSQ